MEKIPNQGQQYSSRTPQDKNSDSKNCLVCTGIFGRSLTVCPKGHAYCGECITTLQLQPDKCPKCKAPLPELKEREVHATAPRFSDGLATEVVIQPWYHPRAFEDNPFGLQTQLQAIKRKSPERETKEDSQLQPPPAKVTPPPVQDVETVDEREIINKANAWLSPIEEGTSLDLDNYSDFKKVYLALRFYRQDLENIFIMFGLSKNDIDSEKLTPSAEPLESRLLRTVKTKCLFDSSRLNVTTYGDLAEKISDGAGGSKEAAIKIIQEQLGEAQKTAEQCDIVFNQSVSEENSKYLYQDVLTKTVSRLISDHTSHIGSISVFVLKNHIQLGHVFYGPHSPDQAIDRLESIIQRQFRLSIYELLQAIVMGAGIAPESLIKQFNELERSDFVTHF
ncbi:hypothetical protein [Parendozoicomonas haliclonae]|uniref:RING-type domain-containing protein n=1 Tax=Parendozoicomonas haliclonae TaxID=1960125 RepID=A0A1X7AP80_9GAMM|nr:hypothetical protein [Parendozoicomonas haliclonae]SMA49900.1 hypothetical protein EHSB41UT_03691 [Parendozoicomonas haliclonae]